MHVTADSNIYHQNLTLLALDDQCLSQLKKALGRCKADKKVETNDDLMAILATVVHIDDTDTNLNDGDEDAE